jgi:hypothetical protein
MKYEITALLKMDVVTMVEATSEEDAKAKAQNVASGDWESAGRTDITVVDVHILGEVV